ncbi:MAG: PHP domain-containing protein, partial [Clostridia bacterium]|nr:PHP domain-containing protein [Clostridia bacterium]
MAGDLHCHTKLSDGSMGIEELIALAKGAGLKSSAITDHDTLAGAMRGKVIGERAGLNVIPGVEFSCKDSKTGRKVHLLCYNPKYPDRLQGLCKEISDKRKSAGQVMATEVMRRYPIPAALIKKWATGSTNIYKVHIMSALMDAGYTTTIYGRLYERLFGENGIVKGELDYPDIRDVIPQVKESGGVA